jgi:predicted extracellular nuclease
VFSKYFKTPLLTAFFYTFFLAACSDYQKQQDTSSDFSPPQATTEVSLRIVGMNLENYFNGDGRGSGYPTPRGAKTAGEFHHQRERIGAAIKALQPHAIGVMELENDGFDAVSAAEDIIQLANAATDSPWAVARPLDDRIGTDKIAVGLFYRSDIFTPIGPAQTLTGPEFKRSRQPLAQVLQLLPDGEKILFVINHLKSKGSCPDSGVNTNHDNQGCWNDLRTISAKKMTEWTSKVAANAGTDNILILGDMNAYRSEDPIVAIREAGFIELMDDKQEEVYSFVYRGRRGTLDYAFTSDILNKKVEGAYIWHVNTDLPETPDPAQPWLGFSDHDPVVVDIRLRQSNTSD